MKELSLEEVLRIAGGVPPAATLDELTYRTSEPRAISREPGAPDAEPGLRPRQGD